MARTDTRFGKKLKKYGAIDFQACYNCGNCTAVCGLAGENDAFPREMIRYSVIGMEGEIRSSLKPWLCYYCGDCSVQCPMEAKPGELMMSLRRYLTGEYDWTGISGFLYRNLTGYLVLFLVIILACLGLYGLNPDQQLWMKGGHLFEMAAIASVFAFILLPNLFRMWYFTIGSGQEKYSLKSYFVTLKALFLHMFTQKQSLSCDEELRDPLWYAEHLVLVFSYLLLLFTTVFLDWFATTNPVIQVAGYVFSGLIFIVTADFIRRRSGRKDEKSSYSHPSDWFFVIWLSLVGVTTFAVRLLIDLNLLQDAFPVYLVHLIVLVQWALIIVPFGKWTHFLYRSFAMYFHELQQQEAGK